MRFIVILFFASLLAGQTTSFISAAKLPFVHDVFLIPLFVAAVWRVVKQRRLRIPKLTIPICTFLAAGVLSLIANAYRFSLEELFESSMYLVRWSAYAVTYIVVIQGIVSRNFWLWGLFGVGTGFSLLGIVQYILYPDIRNLLYLGWDPHYHRLVATLFDPNFMGLLLVFAVFLSYHLLQKTGKSLIWIVMIIQTLALILTFSRSSYLAFIAGMIMYWEIGRKKAVSNALWVILVFLLVIVYIPKPGGDTLRLDRMMSTTSRIDNWRYSIRLFMRSSLFGHGFNTLRLVGLRDEAWTLDAEGIESRAGAGIDNSVLYVAASAGTLGLIAYTWLIVSVLALLRPGKTEGIVRPLRAMLIAALIHSMFINSLFYPWIMVWLWILIGVAEFESGRGTIYRW